MSEKIDAFMKDIGHRELTAQESRQLQMLLTREGKGGILDFLKKPGKKGGNPSSA